MKPYIEMKSGRDIFKATHVTVEPEMTPNGDIMYCLVGYDMNNYRRKNLSGSRGGEKSGCRSGGMACRFL